MHCLEWLSPAVRNIRPSRSYQGATPAKNNLRAPSKSADKKQRVLQTVMDANSLWDFTSQKKSCSSMFSFSFYKSAESVSLFAPVRVHLQLKKLAR